MFCKYCGSEVQPEHKFCMSCGAKLEPVQDSTPVQESTLIQESTPIQEKTPIPEPNLNADNTVPKAQKPAKKSKKPIIIGAVAAASVAVIAAAGVLVWHNMSSSGDENDDDTVVEDVTEETVPETENTESVEESTDDVHGMLVDKLDSVIDSMVYLEGTSQDIYSGKGHPKMLNNGYIGAVIKDVSGDGVEDLIVVYTDEAGVYTDIYTVEDSEIVVKQEGLMLLTIDEWDSNKTAVYLKNTQSGYNLVAESYLAVSHYTDGVKIEIDAYSCADHKYINITDYTAAGSDIDEERINTAVVNATKAGLVNITTAFSNLFLAQDSDVELIAGYTAAVNDGFDYEAFCNQDNYVYAQADIAAITEAGEIQADAQTAFIEKLSGSGEAAFTGDFVFPMSDQVLLTEDDVMSIIDDQEKLSIARNEIYARHGRMFDTEWLQDYFNSKSWYEGIYSAADFDQNVTLSDIETQNAAFLLEIYNQKYGN